MTFTDRKPGFRRTYSLADDSLVIEGRRWSGSGFRQEFNLAKVKPEPDEHRLKDDTSSALVGLPGLIVFMIAVLAGTAIYARSPFAFYALLVIGIAAMLAGFVFGGKMRVFLFKSHDEVPLFDIASRGRGASTPEFETFLTELKSRIRAANAKHASK